MIYQHTFANFFLWTHVLSLSSAFLVVLKGTFPHLVWPLSAVSEVLGSAPSIFATERHSTLLAYLDAPKYASSVPFNPHPQLPPPTCPAVAAAALHSEVLPGAGRS